MSPALTPLLPLFSIRVKFDIGRQNFTVFAEICLVFRVHNFREGIQPIKVDNNTYACDFKISRMISIREDSL